MNEAAKTSLRMTDLKSLVWGRESVSASRGTYHVKDVRLSCRESGAAGQVSGPNDPGPAGIIVTSSWRLFTLRRRVMVVLASTTIFASSARSPSQIQSDARTALRQVVAAGRLAELRWPSFSDYQVYLKNFYEPSGYALAWIHGGTTTPQARGVIEALQHHSVRNFHRGRPGPGPLFRRHLRIRRRS